MTDLGLEIRVGQYAVKPPRNYYEGMLIHGRTRRDRRKVLLNVMKMPRGRSNLAPVSKIIRTNKTYYYGYKSHTIVNLGKPSNFKFNQAFKFPGTNQAKVKATEQVKVLAFNPLLWVGRKGPTPGNLRAIIGIRFLYTGFELPWRLLERELPHFFTVSTIPVLRKRKPRDWIYLPLDLAQLTGI